MTQQEKVNEGSIDLEKDGDGALKPITDAGVRKDKDELAPLSEIIDILNRMDKNQDIVARILDDNAFGEFVKDWMLRKVCTRLNEQAGTA